MMHILTLPAWSDNAMILGHNGREAMVVDPCDAAIARRVLQELNLTLTHILITHHHADHTAGAAELQTEYNCIVTGPNDPRAPCITHPVGDGEVFLAAGAAIRALAVPGHTRSHLAFHCGEESLLFSGDTLFVAGCGRVLEGTAAQMWQSLLRLRALPDDTRLYCGHDYTRENLEFAAHQEPRNAAVHQALQRLDNRSATDVIPIESTIAQEKATNPFLRCDEPTFRQHVLPRAKSPAERFAELRRLKDQW